MNKIASVSVAAYGKNDLKLFDYLIPDDATATIGSLVKVGFGKQKSIGVVCQTSSQTSIETNSRLLQIESLELDQPLPNYLVKLGLWMMEYYAASPRAVWRTILPSGLNQKSRISSRPSIKHGLEAGPVDLNPEQISAVKTIQKAKHRGYLLHGITGSGKTEVYIQLISQQFKLGKSVILLVPEISLTPQMVERLGSHFGSSLFVNHSRLTPAKRKRIWLDVLESNKPLLIIGPRSSLFMPLPKLGVVIVDEEHEGSYKQENNPSYQVNQVVAKLCQITDARYILGSATPSLQTYWLAQQAKIGYLPLTKRALNAELPTVSIVNLQDKPDLLSSELINAIKQTLSDRKQVILFLNRRGSANALICNHCGTVVRCPRCDMSLVFHGDLARLLCHYCGYKVLPPNQCENCHQTDLEFVGSGTKKVESQIKQLFPNHQVSRLDSDNADLSHVEEVFEKLRSGELDIIIGTQMIARGLDLPNVTLVGVISTESMLAVPDFSSSERTFQLLTQVAGRAGRGSHIGKVIVQTLSPNHPAILAAAQHDYLRFYTKEIELRQAHAYPPYVYLVKLVCGHRDAKKADDYASDLVNAIKQKYGSRVVVLGPAERVIRKIAGKNQRQIIIKSRQRSILLEIVRNLKPDWKYELDPINLI